MRSNFALSQPLGDGFSRIQDDVADANQIAAAASEGVGCVADVTPVAPLGAPRLMDVDLKLVGIKELQAEMQKLGAAVSTRLARNAVMAGA